MASSCSSENEGLAELLKETLKELRNISSELGEQSKAIQAMTKAQSQPLSLAAEPPIDNNTTKSRPPISASPPADQSEPLEYTHSPEERDFWGDIDERFFSEGIPQDYLEFIKNELYYNNSKQSISKDEPRDTTTSQAGSVAPRSPSPDESRITASSPVNDPLDIPVAQYNRRPSNSSEIDKAPQTVVTQSLKIPNTSSTMSNGQEFSGIRSLRGPSTSPAVYNAPPASSAQSVRESRVSASTERSMKSLRSLEYIHWDWFKKIPFDGRLKLGFESFQSFLSTKDRFENCDSSFEIRDWIHQWCYFDYNLSEFGYNDFFRPTAPPVFAFAPDADSGRLCTCKGICDDSSHASISPIAEIYSRRKKAQLRSQAGERAQWRRVILIKDMSYMYKSVEQLHTMIKMKEIFGFSTIDVFTEHRLRGLIPMFYMDEEEMRILRLSETMLQSAWRSHGLCKRLPKSDYRRDGANFQITFYEMVPEHEVGRGIWKTGAFRNDNVRNWERVIYNVENDNLFLRRSCVTIVGIIRFFQEWSPENWTMLLLTPSSTSIAADIYEDSGQAVDREFIVAFSGIVDRSTRVVVRHWDILANYFEKLLSESDTLLEPDLHDLLLVDDSKYSKSKKYFWALNILKEIESDVAAVISQLEGFMDFSDNSLLKRYFRLPEGKMSEAREMIVKKKLGVLKEDLVRLQSRFSDQRELTKDLRDGLFNASAVMESRASTRLGENVRLLTFVSIFFLPLSFTMSIWSINDSALANINIMVGVAVVLGTITYFVVFNVNNIVFLSNQFIKKLKAGTIEHMKKNDNTVWKQRGEGLTEPALANDQNATPSSWRIPQYVWLLAWNWISAIVAHMWVSMRNFFGRLAKKKVEQTEQSV
ncbi:uncharacterized protein EAE98_007561 [Botrytis deweyae]|uniref:VASt domain-containing protein n=1 Tax=Botrytis deweyae TaxID=2478750 RepID=A0ABQ7IGL9_9HELO|nr:uncharacterized protein EAE98_007561 [Botrytis deweyae]KAF7923743.1 hypothetical protein EAE98_007561 [Botrytis deweyae]